MEIMKTVGPVFDLGELYPRFLRSEGGDKTLQDLLYHPEPEELDIQVSDRFCVRGLMLNAVEHGYITVFGNVRINVYPVRGKDGEVIGAEIRGFGNMGSYYRDTHI